MLHVTCDMSYVTCCMSHVTYHMYTLKCTPGITRSPESIDMLRYESKFYVVRLSEALLVGKEVHSAPPPLMEYFHQGLFEGFP